MRTSKNNPDTHTSDTHSTDTHTPGDQAAGVRALRTVTRLVTGYLVVSVLTLVAAALLRNHHADVNAAVWIRGSIVAISSAVLLGCARASERGSRGAFRRLRILSLVMVLAIAAVVSLPGTFPVWMKLEQALCGLDLIAVSVLTGKGRWAFRSVDPAGC
jgi:hypothetical protein